MLLKKSNLFIIMLLISASIAKGEVSQELFVEQEKKSSLLDNSETFHNKENKEAREIEMQMIVEETS